MNTYQECIDVLKASKADIQRKFDVKSMRVFGSVARGQATHASDIDVFVEMPGKLFLVLKLREYLCNLLNKPVDVVRAHNGLDPFLIKEINRDGIEIFA